MSQKSEAAFPRMQPYDTSFKAFFDALLGRTTLLTAEDKRRVRHVMLNEFHGLLDEGYFVQLRREEGRAEGFAQGEAKGREEGRQEGLEEGLVEGLQEALLMVTELRSRFARCLTRLSLTAQLY
jgi:flagellar biosynthesis/type III secretory pathway protein FliH